MVAAREQVLEELERALQPARSRAIASGLARAGSIASAIRFGSRFQTRLNQSMKISTSARRAASAGYSGGSGKRSLEVLRIAVESAMHVIAVDEHRHEVLSAELAHRRAVVRVHLDRLDLDAFVRERERDALDVGGVGEA